MEKSKLIFSLDHSEDGPIVSFSKDKPQTSPDFSPEMDLNLGQDHNCPLPGLPHSPSFPGSLTDLAAACEPLTTSLVKSSSSDLETIENSPLKGKPLLSLVKSLSTEISRKIEPVESLSKSDSKLHLHPCKQLTQPKIPEARPEEGGLCESDPPSEGSMSPTESKGSSLIADFEDTRRKFSEAMHDQLSVFSKMIGDESPKQGRTMSTGDSPVSNVSDLKCRKRADIEHRGVFDTHVRKLSKKSLIKLSALSEQQHQITDSQNENNSFKDAVQVGECCRSHPYYQSMLSVSSLPFYWLLPVGLLAYGFFVLPLPPYVTGLSVGVACGFILGLMVVFMIAPRCTKRNIRTNVTAVERKHSEESILEGWMNETYSYDPETFHPSTTHSVYVSLEGSQLQLSYPSANIHRWASLNETPPEAVFLYSRVYQLADSKISLLPSGLARKRVWNKKYPICIVLASENGEEQEEAEERVENLVTLYLFGRTGRDKEEWFQHFLSVSKKWTKSSVSDEISSGCVCVGETVKDGGEEMANLTGAMKTRTLLDYSAFMAQFISEESYDVIPSPTDKEGPATSKSVFEILNEDNTFGVQPGAEADGGLGSVGCSAEGQPGWVNSLVGRIFWDFLREKYWTDLVAHKIQKKLSKIKLPYFMNELTLADLDMGSCLPQVISTSKPTLDRRGLWLELEVMYTGCLHMTLETKMNLCKLGKDGEVQDESLQETLQFGSKPRLSILADSDEESSSAGSSDEEDVFEPQASPGDKGTVVVADGHSGNSTGRKILRFVDKIAKSKYFQKATENEYIKKKIAEVSNMPLMLSVEVQELSGTLAVNIPPPPTDRIWYSFRVPPRLDLHVRPMLGEREVTFTHVTEWIEKKLQCEFQKVFVMPNMDDIYLPLMTSGLESTPVSQHSSVPSSSQQSSMESQEYLSE